MKKNIFKQNIKRLDEQIATLTGKLVDETLSVDAREDIVAEIGILIDYRTKLYESNHKSSLAPAIISGGFGTVAILIVLYYEKTDVVTSKAYAIATRMFGG